MIMTRTKDMHIAFFVISHFRFVLLTEIITMKKHIFEQHFLSFWDFHCWCTIEIRKPISDPHFQYLLHYRSTSIIKLDLGRVSNWSFALQLIPEWLKCSKHRFETPLTTNLFKFFGPEWSEFWGIGQTLFVKQS